LVGSPIPVSAPEGIAVTPNGKRVYVTSEPNTVLVIDTATNTIVGTPIPLGIGPSWVAITPDGKHAYVANTGAGIVSTGTVAVIKSATNKVVATIPVGMEPEELLFTPDGKRAYVANFDTNDFR
jgi:YVTN family beta-propeller protein